MEKEMEKTCGNCVCFIQHYRKRPHSEKELYDTVGCGHCVYPRVKTRTEETKACKHWKTAEIEEALYQTFSKKRSDLR